MTDIEVLITVVGVLFCAAACFFAGYWKGRREEQEKHIPEWDHRLDELEKRVNAECNS